jgi:antitoxin component YwqK of YwqJK toxin-antitoxin module
MHVASRSHALIAVITAAGKTERLARTLAWNASLFDACYVLLPSGVPDVEAMCARHGARIVPAPDPTGDHTWWRSPGALASMAHGAWPEDTWQEAAWLAWMEPDLVVPRDFRTRLAAASLVPGQLYGSAIQDCPDELSWQIAQLLSVRSWDWPEHPPATGPRDAPLLLFQPGAAAPAEPAEPAEHVAPVAGLGVMRLPPGEPTACLDLAPPRLGPLRDDARHGEVRCVYTSGQRALRGEFSNGLATGRWRLWYPDGAPAVDAEYAHGARVYWHARSPSGAPLLVLRYQHGVLHGRCRGWHESGALAWQATFHRGQPDGLIMEWDSAGNLLSRIGYRRGEKHGRAEIWYPDGHQAVDTRFVEGLEHGAYRAWHPGGVLAYEGRHWYGKSHGPFITWYENGQKQSQGVYRNGLTHGRTAFWDRVDGDDASLIPASRSTALRVITDNGREVDLVRHDCAPAGEHVLSLRDAFIGFEGLVFDRDRILVDDEVLAISLDQLRAAGLCWRDARAPGVMHVAALRDIRWPASWPLDPIHGHPRWRRPPRPDPPVVVERHERLLTVVHKYAANFCHWLLEALPRLLAARPLIDADPALRILIDLDFGGCFDNVFAAQHLALCGIDPARIVPYDPARIYAAHEVVYPGPVHRLRPSAERLRRLRQALRPAPHGRISGHMDDAPVLVITRQQAASRHLRDHDRMMAALRQELGADAVCEIEGGILPEAENMAMFARARAIVGVHGAGLVNVLFAATGTPVIEILPEDYAEVDCFAHLCRELGMSYRAVRTAPTGVDEAVSVEPGEVVAAVRSALAR